MSLMALLKKLKPDEVEVGLNIEFAHNEKIGEIFKAKRKKRFSYAVIDSSVDLPFVYDNSLKETARTITSGAGGGLEKALKIYEWIEGNITYENDGKYRNALEVFKDRKGVCGSISFLYVTLARLNGLEAYSVDVVRDNRNRKVKHGCAAVIINEKTILVDNAYHEFDIRHRKYSILDDKTITEMFQQWRSKK